eukprot:TRINITY_DN46825_c0_g1_i1.p2 TRINITY_DN46825_c0_g1~~TRINITY_DN46825_c0_g1_i1.p2  ORF type:complete len:110 (-),score=6.82 TRINITY_DN46825_c0_g1_i1:222-551(-)
MVVCTLFECLCCSLVNLKPSWLSSVVLLHLCGFDMIAWSCLRHEEANAHFALRDQLASAQPLFAADCLQKSSARSTVSFLARAQQTNRTSSQKDQYGSALLEGQAQSGR